MKIALVNLPSSFLINDKVFPPLGILYIASALRELGHEVVWYDLAGKSEDELKNIFINESIIFITLTSPQVPICELFITELKKKDKNKKFVVGGCGVSSINYDFPCDIIIKGEGETVLKNVIDLIKLSIDTDYQLGQIVQEFGQTDINKGLLPARDLIEKEEYSYLINDQSSTSMVSSRGCCFNCIYCVDGNKKGVRLLSVLNCYREINQIYDLGWRGIMFFDDIFTLKLDRLRQITYYLKHKKLLYRCFTHVNFVNERLCKILADTGCKEVGIGIESGSDQILLQIKKGFTSKKGINAIKMLKKHYIRVKTFFMIGLPSESHNTISDTQKFIDIAKPDDMDFSVYTPFPGTSLYRDRSQYDIQWCEGDLTHFKGKVASYKTTVNTSQLTSQQLIIERDKLEKEYKHG